MPFDLVWVSLGEESPEIDQNRHQVISGGAQVIFDKEFNTVRVNNSGYIMRTEDGISITDFFVARPYYSNNEGKLTISEKEPILPGALVVFDNNLILEDTKAYSGERSLFSNFAVRYPETIPANV